MQLINVFILDKLKIIVILCLYIDDIMIHGSKIQVINIIKSLLSKHFNIKDLGFVNVILGIKLLKKIMNFL
jgi:hypothetical protein